MAQIQNTSTIKEIRTAAGLSISEGFPQQLGNQIVPVININPKDYRTSQFIRFNQSGSSGALSIATTSEKKDTFITACSMGIIKDAVADMTTGYVSIIVIIDGLERHIVSMPTLTLTAQNSFISVSFPSPIKVDRNSAITLHTQTHSVGVASKSASIVGYEVEAFENL